MPRKRPDENAPKEGWEEGDGPSRVNACMSLVEVGSDRHMTHWVEQQQLLSARRATDVLVMRRGGPAIYVHTSHLATILIARVLQYCQSSERSLSCSRGVRARAVVRKDTRNCSFDPLAGRYGNPAKRILPMGELTYCNRIGAQKLCCRWGHVVLLFRTVATHETSHRDPLT